MTGSFDDWKNSVSMERVSPTSFEAEIEMKGEITFKFIVDDVWRTSTLYDVVRDANGNENNFLDAEAHASKQATADETVVEEAPISVEASEQVAVTGFTHPSTEIVVEGLKIETHQPFNATDELDGKGKAFALQTFDSMKPALSPIKETFEEKSVEVEGVTQIVELERVPLEEDRSVKITSVAQESVRTLKSEDGQSHNLDSQTIASQIVHTSKKSKTLRGRMNQIFMRSEEKPVKGFWQQVITSFPFLFFS